MERVLLVDDEVDICLLLSSILQREGFQTSYALSLNEAEGKLEREQFAVVFLDLNLPDGVGYSLIPQIKKFGSAKIVVVSAYDSEKEQAVKEGADYFIAKPFRKDNIISALQKLHLT